MKLRKIKWNNHPILGCLELDLVNYDDTPYDTIVIAGENGTGKTTILETVYSFLNQGPITPFEYIEYQVEDIKYKAFPLGPGNTDSFFRIENLRTDEIKEIRTNRTFGPEQIKTNTEDPRHYGCAYTKACANYEAQQIRTISASTIDGDIYNEKTEPNATALKQLIIDIQTQDNNDYSLRGQQNPNIPNHWEQFEPRSRIHRFAYAFNNFFNNNLTYNGIGVVNNAHEVFFRKNNANISIDKLSTGESQIVFRGTYLLKNVTKLEGSVIFIDEPEISMHPLWQQKILSYYKGLFTNDGQQKAQMIIATHSQGVISEALQNTANTKIIVLKCDEGGNVISGDLATPLLLNNTSSAEIGYQAFGIASTDYHNALYGYIEAEGWMTDYEGGQPTVEYIKLKKDGSTEQKQISLSQKIRHIIHHPENRDNSYAEEELRRSIESMRDYISRHS